MLAHHTLAPRGKRVTCGVCSVVSVISEPHRASELSYPSYELYHISVSIRMNASASSDVGIYWMEALISQTRLPGVWKRPAAAKREWHVLPVVMPRCETTPAAAKCDLLLVVAQMADGQVRSPQPQDACNLPESRLPSTRVPAAHLYVAKRAIECNVAEKPHQHSVALSALALPGAKDAVRDQRPCCRAC